MASGPQWGGLYIGSDAPSLMQFHAQRVLLVSVVLIRSFICWSACQKENMFHDSCVMPLYSYCGNMLERSEIVPIGYQSEMVPGHMIVHIRCLGASGHHSVCGCTSGPWSAHFGPPSQTYLGCTSIYPVVSSMPPLLKLEFHTPAHLTKGMRMLVHSPRLFFSYILICFLILKQVYVE